MWSIHYQGHSVMKVVVAPVWLKVMIEWQMLSFWDKLSKPRVCQVQVQDEYLLFLAPQILQPLASIVHVHVDRQNQNTVVDLEYHIHVHVQFPCQEKQKVFCCVLLCMRNFLFSKYLLVMLHLTLSHSRSKCDLT